MNSPPFRSALRSVPTLILIKYQRQIFLRKTGGKKKERNIYLPSPKLVTWVFNLKLEWEKLVSLYLGITVDRTHANKSRILLKDFVPSEAASIVLCSLSRLYVVGTDKQTNNFHLNCRIEMYVRSYKYINKKRK